MVPLRKASFLFLASLALAACSLNALKPVGSTAVPQLPTRTHVTKLPTETPTSTATRTPSLSPTPLVNHTTSGRLVRDETWRGEILITGDIEIPAGVTLTIEPGTTVRFTAGKDDRQAGGWEDMAAPERVYFPNDPPAVPAKMIVLVVYGRLVARGTAAQGILFSSDSATPSVTDWGSIPVEGEGAVVLEYATIEYNYWGLQLNSDRPEVSITRNTFRHIATCCICAGYHPIETRVEISDNTFQDCRHEAVDTHGEQSLVVKHNRFIDNQGGVAANDDSTPLIENNLFRNNHTGIGINDNDRGPAVRGNEFEGHAFFAIWLYSNSTAVISDNNFHGNAGNIGVGNSSLGVSAGNNWWGTLDEGLIRYLITDGQRPARSRLGGVPALCRQSVRAGCTLSEVN